MKQIRRSLKNDRHQSPPSSGGSHQSSASMAYQQQQQGGGGHHVLGNGTGMGVGQSSGVTLPPVRTQGKTPPTKVIRAINSYKSIGPPELSFEAGDFFHVMGDGQPRPKGGNSAGSMGGVAQEELWYDAHNPLTRARGIVPESYFQVLGRNERDNKSGGPALSPPPMQNIKPQQQPQFQQQQQQQASSIASTSKLAPAQSNGISPSPSPSSANFPHRGSSGQPKPRTVKPSPLYGVVQYDFIAERADELDARRGEPIIVIAQSNHEWFVAKPIGRLGGPGLIPVSFVAISDSTTGEPLPEEKVQEMIASGMVPPVDEWKKATAEYKQASIPLGRFEFSSQSTPVQGSAFAPQQQSQGQQFASSSSTSLPYGRQSASANASSASLGQPGLGRPPSGLSANNTSRFTPNTSTSSLHKPQQSSFDAQFQSQARSSGQDSSRGMPTSNSGQLQQFASNSMPQAQSNEHISPTDEYFGNVQQGEQGSVDEMYDRYGLVTHATVESFHSEEENYWFHLRVHFGQSGHSLILYRLYDDFLEFQMALMDEHPVEAGKELPPDARPDAQPQRIIPKMPGPVEHVDEVVCAQRVDDLTVYLKGLCGLPDYLRMHALFYEFFMPRAGDVEVAGPDEQARARWESIKAKQRAAQGPRGLDEEVVEYLDQMGSVTDAMGNTNLGGSNGQHPSLNGKASHTALPQLNTNASFGSGYGMPSAGAGGEGSQHTRQGSGSVPPPSAGGYISRLSDHSAPSQSAGSGVQFTSPWASSSANSQPAAAPPPFVKIKIFHRNTDDLIAIRVPPSIKLDALLDKVRERLGGDVSHVRYRDEGDRPISQSQAAAALTLPGGARLVELRDDVELDSWIKGAQRLVAYVD